MKKNIFIGFEGGSSKSKVRVEDAAGNCIGEAKSGPTNVRLSVEMTWDSVLKGVKAALAPLDLSLLDPDIHYHIGLGLAGSEEPLARYTFIHTEHPFKTLLLNSDGYTACLGSHAGSDGAVIIIGTGVVGFQIEQDKQVQIGGWGFPYSDCGGGAWLGLRAVQLTLRSLDGREESSNLTNAILDHFKGDVTSLVVWANRAGARDYGSLSAIVTDHAKANDLNAVSLMRSAADEINQIAAALAAQSENKTLLPCCLFGSLAGELEAYLSEDIHRALVSRKNDGTVGAILMLKKHLAMCS